MILMTEPVKRKVKVVDARYIDDADSILITGECQEGVFRQQIPAQTLLKGIFGNRELNISNEERIESLKFFAERLKYRVEPFIMVFDPDLDGKIKDNYPLKY